MDVARVNYVLERAIVAFQMEEIEALWEKFKVPTPMQMHKKTGMAIDVSADDAMKGIDAALAPLTSGHGKLTDPNRTPNTKEVAAALNDFIQVAKGMKPKDRKEALARLRDWQKKARAHAKRLQQAASSYRVADVGHGDLHPARNVRDNITKVIAVVSKYRGGGFGKAQTTAKPGTGKKRGPKKQDSPYKAPSTRQMMLGMTPAERKAQASAAMKKWGGKYVVGDATVQTFIRILEAALWKAARDNTSGISSFDFEDELKKLKSRFGSKMASDDKRTLKDLAKAADDIFVVYKDYGVDQVVKDWLINQVKTNVKSGKLPFGPGGTQVRPYVDKRQMGMTFEALKRLKLALVG